MDKNLGVYGIMHRMPRIPSSAFEITADFALLSAADEADLEAEDFFGSKFFEHEFKGRKFYMARQIQIYMARRLEHIRPKSTWRVRRNRGDR